MRNYFLSILCVMSYLLRVSPIFASESALSVSPAIYESVVDPGGFVTSEIYLSNLTDFPLPIKASVTRFLSTESLPESSTATFDASSWFDLDPADFILQPGERKKIMLKITAPRGAEPGGHYATIFFQPLIPEGVASNPQALARVGVLALLIIPGDIQESVTASAPALPSWQAFGPIDLALNLVSSGNIHSVVSGEIKVSDLFYQDLGRIPLPSTTILPGTEKSVQLLWDKRLGFGKYIFTPQLYYGASKQVIPLSPFSLWLIPWPLILVALTLLTFIFKFFILNGNRIKQAWRVLTNKSLQEKE